MIYIHNLATILNLQVIYQETIYLEFIHVISIINFQEYSQA